MGETILLPMPHFASVVGHVVRKLSGFYLDGETPERKAFGMLAGVWGPNGYAVTAVFPLLINMRADEQYRHDLAAPVPNSTILHSFLRLRIVRVYAAERRIPDSASSIAGIKGAFQY